MGAPRGNRNAAGPHKKGWYKKSGTKKFLYSKATYNDRIRKLQKSWDYSYVNGVRYNFYVGRSKHSKYRISRKSL